jgi:hypothetical protein
MTDHDLTDLLERSAGRVPVGAPPVREMLADADRLRRRRTRLRVGAVVLGTAVVVAGIASIAELDRGRGSADVRPTGPDTTTPVPAGRRLVGVGQTAIAVPDDWATNAIQCGTAVRPTVVVDVPVIETCGLVTPDVHDNVWIDEGGNRAMFSPDVDFEIDGVAAQRDTPVCTRYRGSIAQCSGTVFVPSANASYRAQAATAQRVEEILSWIRVVPDLVAVPGFGDANVAHQDDDAGAHYRAELEGAGLLVEVRTEPRPGQEPGSVLDVSPRPGTMVDPGETVTVTEVAEPRGPADEVSVEVNSVGPGDSMDYRGLDDAELRAGGEITIDLGATIWVFGHGKRIGTLAGEVAGPALVLDDWQEGPNYGRSWTAVARGTSTITVTITAAGEPVTVGTVTVRVR